MNRPVALAVVASALALGACRKSAAPPGPPSPPAPPPPQATSLAARSLLEAPLVSSCGTPAVDGVLAAGEWDAAVSLRFGAVLPESAGGGLVPATLRALSDDLNVYFAVELPVPLDRFHLSTSMELDADGSGTITPGDDGIGFTRWADREWGPGDTMFGDFYRCDCLVDGSPAICGPADTDVLEGFPPPGTRDGGAAFGFDGAVTVVELWHPYHAGDPRDLFAEPGDEVPFRLDLRFLDDCPDWPRCHGDTTFPPGEHYRSFVLGCGAPPEEEPAAVRIDVKPGDALPTIRLSSGGTTAVAVLGGAGFDAAAVDRESVFFAGAPVARREDGSAHAALDDVDGDGRADLVLHFETAALQLPVGATEATLAGRTADGRTFTGSDVVRVLP
jgi:hypothetical protein